MYIYASSPKKIVQRDAGRAQNFRSIAYNVLRVGPRPGLARRSTAAVSNTRFTLTPMIRSLGRRHDARALAEGRFYATTVDGGQAGNHAEKKLIHHDPFLTEIGVTRRICNGCVRAILAQPSIQHVSDEDRTYQVIHTAGDVNFNGIANSRTIENVNGGLVPDGA